MVYCDILLIAVGLAESFLLTLAAAASEKIINTKWRLLWLVPAAVCILLMLREGLEPLMLTAYLGSFGLAAGLFITERKKRDLISVICAAVMLISVPCCLLSKSYRKHNDYTGDFEKGFNSIKSHYALTKHKEIDFDALYSKYMPMFEKAEKEHDDIANEIAWNCFCAEFHDGHVGYGSEEKIHEKACQTAGGNDYGLVILKLSDGSFAAVNTDKSLENMGIHLGTRVISWNGESPDIADEKSQLWKMLNFSDIDNENFYHGMCAAGTGGDTAELTYIADDGSEQSVTLPKLGGFYYDRLKETSEILDQGMKAAHMSWTKLNDTTACLRIKFMVYDTASTEKENHVGMKSQIRKGLQELMDEGVKDVVIDIRSNGGGSGDMVKAVASLFAPEGEHYYVTNALWDEKKGGYATDSDGNYIKGEDVTFNGENILGDGGRVLLLVNAHSGSASDHLTKVMSGFENVTVIGFTGPGGAAQGVYSIPLSCGSFQFSSSVLLDRDGSIFIDSGADRQAADDVGERVPLDDAALKALFEDGEDYVMSYALDKLK